MICGCQKRPSAATWLTRILSLVSVPDPSPTADSVTRRCGLLPSHGAQKNVLWDVRHDASQLLRPNTAPGAGTCRADRSAFSSTSRFVGSNAASVAR